MGQSSHRLIKSARVGIALGAGTLLLGLASAQTIADERRALETAKMQSIAADKRASELSQRANVSTSRAERVAAQSAAIAARIQSAEADITAAETRIRLIESMRAEQRIRLAQMQKPAVQLLAALQLMSRRPPALALVQPGSTRDLVHVRAILSSMLPAMHKRTAGLRTEIAKGRALRADADKALQILGTGQKRLVTERAALVQLAALHRQTAQRFSASAMVEQDRAIALGEKARDIVDLIDQLGEASAVRTRLEDLPGPLLRPIRPGSPRSDPVDVAGSTRGLRPYRLPVTGTVVTGLGEVSEAGVRARGLTIRTRTKAQVISPANGRIVFAGPYRGFGNIAIIDHGRGWTTLITDLATLDVRVGDTLVAGSPIGKAGEDHPQITIELRRGTTPVDITPLLG